MLEWLNHASGRTLAVNCYGHPVSKHSAQQVGVKIFYPIMNDAEFLRKARELTLEEAALIIETEERKIAVLSRIACLPECEWTRAALDIQTAHPELGWEDGEAIASISFSRAGLLSERWRLARAVKPTGTFDDWAPLIGAIRLKSPSHTLATNYLMSKLHDAIFEGDETPFKAIAPLIAERGVGGHRNHRIWGVIKTFVRESRELNPHVVDHGVAVKHWPSKKAIIAFITDNPERFPGFVDEAKAWRTLWLESGVNQVEGTVLITARQ